METNITIRTADNGLIVTERTGSGLTATEATTVHLDYMSMQRDVLSRLAWFKPVQT